MTGPVSTAARWPGRETVSADGEPIGYSEPPSAPGWVGLTAAEVDATQADEDRSAAALLDVDDAVGQFLDARSAKAAAAQQAARAADAVAAVYEGRRAVDREAEAARGRHGLVSTAREAAEAWREVVSGFRAMLASSAGDQALARGRGPQARAAAVRLGRASDDRLVWRERIAALNAAAAEAAEKVGTADPEQWAEMQKADEETLASYRERRAAAIERGSVAYPAARQAYEEARARLEVADAQLDTVTEELERRGLDPNRIAEAADRVAREGGQVIPGAVGVEQRMHEQRAAELDAERGRER